MVRLRGMPRGWAGELLVDSHVAAVSRRARESAVAAKLAGCGLNALPPKPVV